MDAARKGLLSVKAQISELIEGLNWWSLILKNMLICNCILMNKIFHIFIEISLDIWGYQQGLLCLVTWI